MYVRKNHNKQLFNMVYVVLHVTYASRYGKSAKKLISEKSVNPIFCVSFKYWIVEFQNSRSAMMHSCKICLSKYLKIDLYVHISPIFVVLIMIRDDSNILQIKNYPCFMVDIFMFVYIRANLLYRRHLGK